MLDTADDEWLGVPGTQDELDELEYWYELEKRQAERLLVDAQAKARDYEARKLAQRIVAEKEALERGPFSSRVHNMVGVRQLVVPKHLMRDVLYTGSVAVFLGNSQVGKSWVLQAIAACAASGLDWPSMQPNTKGKIPVLYIAAEDGGAIKWRLEHWERAHSRQIPDATFYAHAEPVDMLNDVMVDEIIEFVKTFQIRLVIVDTVSACLGGQEETVENFAKLVRNCRRVAKAMSEHGGGSVALAHHFGKDKERGGRGGSSLFNDSDIVWELDGEIGAIKFENKKWKVDEKRKTLNLRLDWQDRSAVHIAEFRPTGESVTVSENRFRVMERHIFEIVDRFTGLNQGYGPSGRDIRGALREIEGFHASDQDILGQLSIMRADGRLLTRRQGRSELYRRPPVQEELNAD